MRSNLIPSLRVAGLLGAAFCVDGASVSAHVKSWNTNVDDSLLLELRSGQYRLGEPRCGYPNRADNCLDFADLIEVLDLPVRHDKRLRRAIVGSWRRTSGSGHA